MIKHNDKLMFSGMFAHIHASPHRRGGAGQGCASLVAHRSERNSPERAKRVFSFWFFFSFARKEEKKNIGVKCNYYIGYSNFDVPIGTPLSFDTKGAKESSQRKRRSACGRKRVAFKKAPQNFWRIGVCEHGALNINLSLYFI